MRNLNNITKEIKNKVLEAIYKDTLCNIYGLEVGEDGSITCSLTLPYNSPAKYISVPTPRYTVEGMDYYNDMVHISTSIDRLFH